MLLPYDRYQRLLTAHKDSDSTKSIVENRIKPSDQIILKQTEDNIEELDSKGKPSIDRLISIFPKALQNSARTLLKYIIPDIEWNEKLEVIIAGRNIPDSNIVDLIKVQLQENEDFKPQGVEEFQSYLRNNIPQSLLSSYRRTEQNGGQNIPPPPGVPVKRKNSSASVKKIKWLKL